MKKYNVIFHIDEIEKVNLVLGNINNLIIDLGEENLQVELLANSEGVKLMIEDSNEFLEKIKNLKLKNVTFAACANSLRQMNLDEKQLFDFCRVVPSGVGELVIKQTNGYAYIKP
ncbi:DsrE family protein [Clostridium bowmanii]|uniref:DsrE family protein n=1 Tax=Clostridium bowmanii TaxID=132925 RepID=UPI001C0B34C7|nr:DsrE family protein [Clostridium bowmanii]MBU3187978.1 DsrE family protein [Clostridium bowmanii]MCA1072155.1 DsrE family protein [Clostridium bowmanii]